MRNLTSLLASTALALVLVSAARAADFDAAFGGPKPAVSGLNGKLELGYDQLWNDSANAGGLYGVGSVSMPLGQSVGVQIDAGIASVSAFGASANAGGAALHAFWRNPDSGLLGLYAHYVGLFDGGDGSVWRVGAEGEAYMNRVSLEAFAGADIANVSGTSQTTFSGDFTAAYYITDNFRLHAGIKQAFERVSGRIGFEAAPAPATTNFSLFADGTISEDAYGVRAGMKIYFGEAGKSLLARHREDDPHQRLFDAFTGAPVVPVEEICTRPSPSECS